MVLAESFLTDPRISSDTVIDGDANLVGIVQDSEIVKLGQILDETAG